MDQSMNCIAKIFTFIILCVHGMLDPTFKFTVEPEDMIVQKKQEVYLNCSAVASSDVIYFWYQNGRMIDLSNGRYKLTDGGNLHIKRIIHRKKTKESDEGYYECVAESVKGHHAIRSKRAVLKVATLSRISVRDPLIKAAEGEDVRFECKCKAVPEGNYSWQHNGHVLDKNNTRYSVLGSGVLIIHNVQKEDRGTYKCFVSNLVRTRHRNYHLKVNRRNLPSRAQLLSSKQTLRPRVGETVEMECTATGVPRPKVWWIYTNEYMDLYGIPVQEDNRTVIRNGIMTIPNVTVTDSGVYECVVEQEGSLPLGHWVDLGVCEPPVLVFASPDMNRILSVTVRIACQFDGNPKPAVSWYKDGKKIVFSGRFKSRMTSDGNLLVINNVDLRDSGYYMCRGENILGTVQHTIRLILHTHENTPGRPKNLRARAQSSTTILLEWDQTKGRRGQRLVAYSVHYLKRDGYSNIENTKVATWPAINVTDLVPFTNYSFYVVSYFSTGASPHSDVIYQRTLEGRPISYPEVEVEPYTETSLLVMWKPLSTQEAQGIISRHQVLYRNQDSPYNHIKDVPAETYSIIITGLEPNTEYDVGVQSGTKAGFPNIEDSGSWEWITEKTFQESKKNKILNLRVISPYEIQASWKDMPGENIEAYRITTRKKKKVPTATLR